jgi:hypothetical protein
MSTLASRCARLRDNLSALPSAWPASGLTKMAADELRSVGIADDGEAEVIVVPSTAP